MSRKHNAYSTNPNRQYSSNLFFCENVTI